MLANQTTTPNYVFNEKMLTTLYTSPFQRMLTQADLEAADLDYITSLVHEMTSNAADFTFYFVGNVDLENLRPLVETYIASIPGNAATARKGIPTYNPALFAKPGSADDTFSTKMATPQTLVAIMEYGTIPFSPKTSQVASIAGQILTNRLIKTVREDMGAVYSIGASGDRKSVV